MIDLSSDDEITVISAPTLRSRSGSDSFSQKAVAPASANATGSASNSLEVPLGRVAQGSQVIELLDSDEEEEMEETQVDTQVEDEHPSVGPSTHMARTYSAPVPSSDDLPEYIPMRSASTGATSRPAARIPPILAALNEERARAAVAGGSGTSGQNKGKGKRVIENDESDNEDPYDAMISKGKQIKGKKRARPSEDDSGSDIGSAKRKEKTTKSGTAAEEKKRKAAQDKLAKETEKLEKAKLREANVLRVGQKSTVSELVVQVAGTGFRSPEELVDDDDDEEDIYAMPSPKKRGKAKEQESCWVAVTDKLRERLGEQSCLVDRPESRAYDLGAEGTMRWTRRVDRKWNDALRKFIPLPEGEHFLVEEDTRLVYMTALELSTLIAGSELSAHLNKLKSKIPSHIHLVLMIMGLKKIFTQLANAAQAVYREDVRAGLAGDSPGGAAKKRKAVGIGSDQPSKETIDYELIKLQVTTKCFIVMVEKEDEAVDWLEQLTKDVGQKPYQRQKHMNDTLLGVSAGEKGPTGSDAADTYRKMLASIKGLTEPVAKSIAHNYPTIRSLYDGWSRCDSVEDARAMLIGIKKTSKVTGAPTHHALGAKTSEKVWRVFNSDNPALLMLT